MQTDKSDFFTKKCDFSASYYFLLSERTSLLAEIDLATGEITKLYDPLFEMLND